MKDRIKQVRILGDGTRKLSQTEFAESLKTTRPAIAAYENGSVTPNDVFIALLCQKYGINEEWLRYGTGEMKTPKTRNQALADFLDSCMDEPDSFKSKFLVGMSKLTDEQWMQIAAIIDSLAK